MALPTTLKTPGVYINERNAFPNSVVGVETAIPAFIGYTEIAEFKGKSFLNTPVQIDSLMDYVRFFGRGPKTKYSFKSTSDSFTADVSIEGTNYKLDVDSSTKDFKLFDALKFFYQNGGGTCFIVSVGTYKNEVEPKFNKDVLDKGIMLLEKETVPTMLVIPDAIILDSSNCYALQQSMLMHCGEQMNRVAILDLYEGYKNLDDSTDNPVKNFRDSVSSDFLSYGAAYYPWLNTSIIQESEVSFNSFNTKAIKTLQDICNEFLLKLDSTQVALLNPCISRMAGPPDSTKSIQVRDDAKAEETELTKAGGVYETQQGTVDDKEADIETQEALVKDPATSPADKKVAKAALRTAMKELEDAQKALLITEKDLEKIKQKINIAQADVDVADVLDKISTKEGEIKAQEQAVKDADPANKEDEIKTLNSLKIELEKLKKALINLPSNLTEEAAHSVLWNTIPNYKLVIETLLKQRNLMAPSAAMAGIYSLVDSQRGVWKAPANVAVSSVISPAVLIDYKQQQDLNAPILGKAICAIRPFIGLGTMVWGARTLDANSLDWRYMNVRRTMIMMEQSIKFAAKAYVFEPNVKNTWVSVKAMITNFLTNLWKLGALAGSVPEDAFSVNVGLGTTMTGVDILEGKMIIEVKVAVSRPAEFIVIHFEQQMQKS